LPLAAQSPTQPKSQTTIIVTLPTVEACPVGMQARQRPGGYLRSAHGEQRVEGLAQRIFLTLTGGQSRQISKAVVTVRGLTAKNRVLPALSTDGDASDITKTLSLTFTPGSGRAVSTNLVLAGFTAVNSIELGSVTYGDGSTWKYSGGTGCRVAPDPLMLIDGQ
jgi:hypothetical protein